MVKELIVNLEESNEEQSYEKSDENLMRIESKEITLKFSQEKRNRVLLHMNKDAMLGFGIELIKFAYNFENESHIHIDPINENHISTAMGLYLTHDSSELVIIPSELGTVENEITKVKKGV